MFDGSNSTSVRHSYRDGKAQRTGRAVSHSGELNNDLVESREDKAIKLNFDNGPKSVEC